MKYVSVPAYLIANLAGVVAQMDDAQSPVVDHEQPDLFQAFEMANDAAMEEREELKARVAYLEHEVNMAKQQLRQEIDSQRVYTQGVNAVSNRAEVLEGINAQLRRNEEATNVILGDISNFANALQESFNDIGLRFFADPNNGEPVILLENPALLKASLEHALAS